MNRWKGRTAIVCDFAGSNTSLVICRDLVKYGLTVLALTTRDGIRQFDKLEKELSQVQLEGALIPMECEVRYEEHVNPVFRFIGERYGGIDLLINYVNSMEKGMILEDDNTSSLRKTMETNVFGLCYVLREAAKLMKSRPEERKDIGHIVNITSAIGDAVGIVGKLNDMKPVNALYPATKNAAIAINECIRQELLWLDMENVKITAIHPGLVETDEIYAEKSTEPAMSAGDVSAALIYALSVKPHVQIESIVIKAMGDHL